MEKLESGKLYTLQQVSDYTGIKLSNLRYWAKAGQMRARKYGRAWMMTQEDIHDLIEHGTREPKQAES